MTKPTSSSMASEYFVGHQFTADVSDDLRAAIAAGLRETGLHPIYGDDAYKSSHILPKIQEMILGAAFAIFDITDANPNVMLELGVAICSRKPFYILCRAGSSIPANVSGLDRIQYQSIRQLTNALAMKIAPHWKQPQFDLSETEVIHNCSRLHEAESLFHRIGEVVKDDKASNKRAWKFGPTLELARSTHDFRLQHAVYGPYEPLPLQGLYKAYFRLKIDASDRPDDLVRIEIRSEGNPGAAKVKGTRTLRGFHFALPDEYQMFSVPFGYGTEDDLEYRILQCGDGVTIHADYVAILDCSVENSLHLSRRNVTSEA